MMTFEGRMRRRIQGELRSVSSWVDSLKRELPSQEMETGGDNTPFSEETEAAQAVGQRELRAQIIEWLSQRVVRLDEALRNLRQGTYGVCAGCGGAIHRERLEALPEVTRCLRCQEVEEAASKVSPYAYSWAKAAHVDKDFPAGH